MSEHATAMCEAYLYAEIGMDLAWQVDIGAVMADFFQRLKDEQTLYGMRCDQCSRTYLPPRLVCGNCWREMRHWVPLGRQGTLVAKTICHYKILDAQAGEPRKTPFVLGLIRLDGADTTLNHFVNAPDPAAVAIGDRVELVLREPTLGSTADMLHFRWLGAGAKS